MKRIVTIVALICAVTFQVNAQTTEAENIKKNAETAVKLADQSPKDGMKQLAAAEALTALATTDKSQFDRAVSYAHKAIEIAQAKKEIKDTLLARSYYMLGNIYLLQNSMDNACDYLELAVDAYEKELGRYDPQTIFHRLSAGRIIISANPDTRRGFLHILQAFYDNETAPANKRIKNLNQLNIISSWAMEQMLVAYTNSNRYALPVMMLDGQRYFIVQTRDWCVGQPLVNWMAPSILRTEAERQAHAGEGIIVVNEKWEFRHLTKEEGQRLMSEFSNFDLKPNSRELEIAPGGSEVMYLQPQMYNELLKRFQEFKDKK